MPPIMLGSTVSEVHFQTEHAGWRTLRCVNAIATEARLVDEALESWMAHHLAALILGTNSTSNIEEIRDLILKLWDRNLTARVTGVLEAVQQQLNSSKSLSPERLSQLAKLVRSPTAIASGGAQARLQNLSDLLTLESRFLYLWLLLEGLDDKINSMDRQSVYVLFGTDTVLSTSVRQLEGFDPKLKVPESGNLDEIATRSLKHWKDIVSCRISLLRRLEKAEPN
jgi:hypothetical protein